MVNNPEILLCSLPFVAFLYVCDLGLKTALNKVQLSGRVVMQLNKIELTFN